MIIRIYRIEEEDILTQSRKDAEEDRLGEDPSPYRVRDSVSGKRMRHWGMKGREQGCSRYFGRCLLRVGMSVPAHPPCD